MGTQRPNLSGRLTCISVSIGRKPAFNGRSYRRPNLQNYKSRDNCITISIEPAVVAITWCLTTPNFEMEGCTIREEGTKKRVEVSYLPWWDPRCQEKEWTFVIILIDAINQMWCMEVWSILLNAAIQRNAADWVTGDAAGEEADKTKCLTSRALQMCEQLWNANSRGKGNSYTKGSTIWRILWCLQATGSAFAAVV